MSTNVTWNGTTYSIPNTGELNWSVLSSFLIDLGTNAAIAQEMDQAIRVATSTPVTVAAATDYAVVTDLAVAGAVAVNLPAGVDGQIFVIVDGKGDAATNNITIDGNGAETIGGSLTRVLNHNRQTLMIQYHAGTTDWKILADTILPGTITTSDISGTIAIAQGGTGQSSQTAAFDALAPTTTKGDLIAHNGTDNIRVAVGTDGQALVADSGAASGLNYASVVTNPMDSAGDMIYGAALGAPTKLDSGTAGSFLVSAGAAAPTWSNTVSLLTYFTGGAASMAYVGTDPEVGGASPFLLTNAHKRVQVINPAGAITVELPTTSILAGDTWTVVNRSTNVVSIRSSDDSAIDSLRTGYMVLTALQATPTTAAHWAVTDVNEGGSYTVTWTVTGGGSVGTPTDVVAYRRINDVVTVIIQSAMTASGTVSTLKFTVPYTIATDVITPGHMSLGGTQAVGRLIITGTTNTVFVTPNYVTSSWAAGANIVNGIFTYKK